MTTPEQPPFKYIPPKTLTRQEILYQRGDQEERKQLAILGLEHLIPLLDPSKEREAIENLKALVYLLNANDCLSLEKTHLTPAAKRALDNLPSRIIHFLDSYKLAIIQGPRKRLIWRYPKTNGETPCGAIWIVPPVQLGGLYGYDEKKRVVMTPLGKMVAHFTRSNFLFSPHSKGHIFFLWMVDGAAQNAAGIKPPSKTRPLPLRGQFDPSTLYPYITTGTIPKENLPPFDLDLMVTSPVSLDSDHSALESLKNALRKSRRGARTFSFLPRAKSSPRRGFRKLILITSASETAPTADLSLSYLQKLFGVQTPEEVEAMIDSGLKLFRLPRIRYADLCLTESVGGFSLGSTVLSFMLTRDILRPPLLLMPIDMKTPEGVKTKQLVGIVFDLLGCWKFLDTLEAGRKRLQQRRGNGQIEVFDHLLPPDGRKKLVPFRNFSLDIILPTIFGGEPADTLARLTHWMRSLPWADAIETIVSSPDDRAAVNQILELREEAKQQRGKERRNLYEIARKKLKELLEKTGRIIGEEIKTITENPELLGGRTQRLKASWDLVYALMNALNGDPALTLARCWGVGERIKFLSERERIPIAGWGVFEHFFPSLYQFLQENIPVSQQTTKVYIPNNSDTPKRREILITHQKPRIEILARMACYWLPASELPWRLFLATLLNWTGEDKREVLRMLTPSILLTSEEKRIFLRGLQDEVDVQPLAIEEKREGRASLLMRVLQNSGKVPLSTAQIAKEAGIPQNFAFSILETLRRSGETEMVGVGHGKERRRVFRAHWMLSSVMESLPQEELLKLEMRYGGASARILAALRLHPPGLTYSQFRKCTGLSLTTIAKIIKNLEEKGMIKPRRDQVPFLFTLKVTSIVD